MTPSLHIACPHCGESFPLAVDPSEGDADFIVDCEICCRPISVRVRFDDDGAPSECEINPE